MSIFDWLRGRRKGETPAGDSTGHGTSLDPEGVIREYFAAIAQHDLDRILATLSPERSRLYMSPTTLDRRRLSIKELRLLQIELAEAGVESVPGYGEQQTFRAEYDLELVDPEDQRDPSLVPGQQWSYFVLVRERPGKPWLIADWGK